MNATNAGIPTPQYQPQSSALTTDPAAIGLRREVVDTSAGPVVIHLGRQTGGPATVMLHGAAGSWTTWTPLLRASDATSDPIMDVIAVDLPGWGASPSPSVALDVEDVSRVVREIAEQCGYSSWRLVGHSLGGFIALDLASRSSGATTEVWLVSGSGVSVIDAIRRPLRGGTRLPGFAGMLLAMRALAPFGRAGLGLVHGFGRLGWMRTLSAPLFARPSTIDASVIDALTEEVRPRSFARAAAFAATYDVESWRSISCSVRAVSGDADVFVGRKDLERFTTLIPCFTHTVIADAGHFAAVEKPRAVLEAFRGR